MNSCLLEYTTAFPIKNRFQQGILTFYFDLVPPFYFPTFTPVLCESRHYFNYLLPQEVCTNLQIKGFPLMKFPYKI